MRPLLRTRLVVVLTCVVAAGFAATWSAPVERTQQEASMLTGKMKTVCIGRFLIDMTEDAQIDAGRAGVDGFDIATFRESIEEFHTRLARRETDLKAQPNRPGGGKNLELVKEISTASGLTGKIFVHSRTVNEGTAANGLELERYRYEGIAVEALVHGDGVSIDLGSDFYDSDKVENLHKLVTQLVPNPRNQTPAEAGFCLDHAFIRDPLEAEQGEQMTMFASLPSHPDIDFLLLLAAGYKPDSDGLLKRGTASEDRLSLMQKARVTRLRAGRREIGGLAGEELVRRVVEENDARVYTFRWEVNGTQEDVLIPHVVFSMTTAKSASRLAAQSISEDAAIHLWEKVSSSIRLTPANARKRASSKAQSMPAAGHAIGRYRTFLSGMQ